MIPEPPPNQYISEKPFSRVFRMYPTYPPLWDTQRAQMRQQRHQPLKTLRVGTKLRIPERYGHGSSALLDYALVVSFALSGNCCGAEATPRQPVACIHLPWKMIRQPWLASHK